VVERNSLFSQVGGKGETAMVGKRAVQTRPSKTEKRRGHPCWIEGKNYALKAGQVKKSNKFDGPVCIGVETTIQRRGHQKLRQISGAD